MSWTNADDRWGYPEGATPESMWKDVRIERIVIDPQIVREYVNELNRLYRNGGARFASFIVSSGGSFDFFASRNRFEELEFFQRFLTHPVVTETLPDVTREPFFEDASTFAWGGSLTLDGDLAGLLVGGGAYEHTKRTHLECKRLGARVCDELFGDRFEDVLVFRSSAEWSAWFCHDGLCSTYVIIDKRLRRVSVLVGSDAP